MPATALDLIHTGEDFTVYCGTTGAGHVVVGRCAHRKTLLHTGRVIDDTIRCLYHGWQYDGSGTIPAGLGDRTTPQPSLAVAR